MLVLNSSLVNTNFTLSKLKCLIFTNSKLLSLFSCSIIQGSTSFWTSSPGSLHHCDLCPCLCLCVVLQTALISSSDRAYCTSCHTGGTPSFSPLCYNIYSSVLFFFLSLSFFLPIIAIFYVFLLTESHSFSYLILSNTSFLDLCGSVPWVHSPPSFHWTTTADPMG